MNMFDYRKHLERRLEYWQNRRVEAIIYADIIPEGTKRKYDAEYMIFIADHEIEWIKCLLDLGKIL